MELSENKMIKIAKNMKCIVKSNMELSLEMVTDSGLRIINESQNKSLSRLNQRVTVTRSMLIQINPNKYINITVHSNAKLKE